MPEAWAKISSAPAEILGLTDRGIIEQGKWADLLWEEVRDSVAPPSWTKQLHSAANVQLGYHLQKKISAAGQFDVQLTCPLPADRPPEAP